MENLQGPIANLRNGNLRQHPQPISLEFPQPSRFELKSYSPRGFLEFNLNSYVFFYLFLFKYEKLT